MTADETTGSPVDYLPIIKGIYGPSFYVEKQKWLTETQVQLRMTLVSRYFEPERKDKHVSEILGLHSLVP